VPVLSVRDVHTYYGSIHALRGISLEVGQGEIVALIGGNGAGKSTTLNTISGIVRAHEGEIVLNGEDLSQFPAHQITAKGVVQVPEGRRIFARLTVFENLKMGAYIVSDKAAIAARIEQAFEMFPRLKERQGQVAGTLSGGEQQMLAISRALMARPKLLLLDEPSLGLAPLIVRQIFEIIKKINPDNNTIIFLVEHNANLALKVAHRGYVMENGAITMCDSAPNLLSNDAVKKAYLGL